MITADWIALGLIVLFIAVGAIVGFGSGLQFFTKGIVGIIISIIICYFFMGVVLRWSFAQDLIIKINDAVYGEGGNAFRVWLVDSAHIGKICFAVIMFLVVQLLRMILVAVLKRILESGKIVFKVINKTVGALLFVLVLVIVVLIIAQIIAWVGGSTAESLSAALEGSKLKLDYLYEHNPLIYIFQKFE